jgi:hypothetical protein
VRQRLLSHLTYANVMATLAVFLVLGGMSYAATGGNFILGKSNSASTATQLSSAAGNALKVSDTNGGTGVYASGGNHTKNTAAVHGQSGAGNAVEGFSTANPASGVFGQDNNANSYGVAGHSDNGVAVVGDSSSGWAMQALGNATQARSKGGFVKAMAFVDPVDHATDPIQQCFNSQLAPSQATNGNCGIAYTKVQTGIYDLNFGFQIDDRFASATPYGSTRFLSAQVKSPIPSNTLEVAASNFQPNFTDTKFYVFVY